MPVTLFLEGTRPQRLLDATNESSGGGPGGRDPVRTERKAFGRRATFTLMAATATIRGIEERQRVGTRPRRSTGPLPSSRRRRHRGKVVRSSRSCIAQDG
jgi:hypothetical protein